MADPVRYPRMTTDELRETFLLNALCEPGKLHLNYIDLDRAVVGFAAPLDAPMALPTDADLRAEYFTERRELGALNVGGAGVITVEGKSYELDNLDVLYIGRGNKQVTFASKDKSSPAVFYLLSYPAHAVYPVALVRKADAMPTELGSLETCNKRTICKYIHLQGARSCQLVMGVTHLAPRQQLEHHAAAHAHAPLRNLHVLQRRSRGARHALHGAARGNAPPRHADKGVVVSPGWSIHAGVGTRAYSFCWGMGGENQDYADMDPAPVESLR